MVTLTLKTTIRTHRETKMVTITLKTTMVTITLKTTMGTHRKMKMFTMTLKVMAMTILMIMNNKCVIHIIRMSR